MTDEEKKALENMRIFARVHPDMAFVTAKEMDIVVTLVEKQQKEIEKLKKYKEGYKLLSYSLDNYTSKDKIKAKIEEVKDGIYDAKIVLQSLLKEE